jgi:AcrR family transcriptional regulator
MKTFDPRSNAPEDTRERIMAAARETVSRKGKRGATTREIADVAGVNEATLFRHFGSKEQLIIAVAQRYCGVEALRSTLGQMTGDLEDDLLALGRTMMSNMEESRDMIVWSLAEDDEAEGALASTTWRPATAIHDAVSAFFATRVADGSLRGDARKLALVFMGFIFVHVLSRKKFQLDGIYGTTEDALRYYIHVFLTGVRSK